MTQQPVDGPDESEQKSGKSTKPDSDGDAASTETGHAAAPELEWWQYPGMPFSQKPERPDYICMFGIMAAGVYGVVLLPFRVWLLANAPWVALALTGSVPATVAIGAAIPSGERLWPLAMVIGALSAIKFDWLFWLAGRRWGEGVIDWLTGGASRGEGWLSRMRTKIARWTHRLAQRWAIPMILLTYVPVIPVPSAIVFAALGMGRMRLRTFMIIDFCCALLNRATYVYLGYRIGLPVLEVIEELNKYSLWIALGTIAVIMFFAFRNAAKTQNATKNQAAEDEESK